MATPECQGFAPSLVDVCFSGASPVGSFPLDSSHCVHTAIYTLSQNTGLSMAFVAPEAEVSPL